MIKPNKCKHCNCCRTNQTMCCVNKESINKTYNLEHGWDWVEEKELPDNNVSNHIVVWQATGLSTIYTGCEHDYFVASYSHNRRRWEYTSLRNVPVNWPAVGAWKYLKGIGADL